MRTAGLLHSTISNSSIGESAGTLVGFPWLWAIGTSDPTFLSWSRSIGRSSFKSCWNGPSRGVTIYMKFAAAPVFLTMPRQSWKFNTSWAS